MSAPTSAAASTTSFMRPGTQPDRPDFPIPQQSDACAADLQGVKPTPAHNDRVDATTIAGGSEAEQTDSPLAPYLPRLVRAWSKEPDGPRFRVEQGSLVSVDISGFTALAERLAVQGQGRRRGARPPHLGLLRRADRGRRAARRRRAQVPRRRAAPLLRRRPARSSAPPGRPRTCSGRSSRSAAPRARSARSSCGCRPASTRATATSSSPSCRTGSCSSPARLRRGSSSSRTSPPRARSC